jgi:hypothetical protein
MNREERAFSAKPLRSVRAESMAVGNNWHNAAYARSDKVIRRDVGGETVLVPVAASGAADLEYLYRMNAVGAAVWDLLDGRRTITEIAGQIRASFDISRQDPGQIRAAFDTSDAKQAGGWRLEAGGTETKKPTAYSQQPHSRQNTGEGAADKVEEDVRAFLADLEVAKLASRHP